MLTDTLKAGLDAYRIGTKIRDLRTSKSLGLAQLGDHTGLSAGMLSKIERGSVFPTLPTLLRIALVFGVGLEYFFDNGDRPVLEIVRAGAAERVHPARARLAGQPEGALLDALRAAQAELVNGESGPDRTLHCTTTRPAKIAETRPRDHNSLERIPGMGPQKTQRFGDAFLAVLERAELESQ